MITTLPECDHCHPNPLVHLSKKTQHDGTRNNCFKSCLHNMVPKISQKHEIFLMVTLCKSWPFEAEKLKAVSAFLSSCACFSFVLQTGNWKFCYFVQTPLFPSRLLQATTGGQGHGVWGLASLGSLNWMPTSLFSLCCHHSSTSFSVG